jgi:hypothetical protein
VNTASVEAVCASLADALVARREMLGPALVQPVRGLLGDLDGTTLAEYLVGGVIKGDLHPVRAATALTPLASRHQLIIPTATGPRSACWPWSPPATRP